MKNIIKYEDYICESKYSENVLIYLDISNNSCYLKSKFYDIELNSKLLNALSKKLNINNTGKLSKYKIPLEDIDKAIIFLEKVGLKKETLDNSIKRIIFKGTITIKDIKKIK